MSNESDKPKPESSDNKPIKIKSTKSSCLPTLSILLNIVLVGICAYLANLAIDKETTFSDCGDYFRKGHRLDGIYEIQPLANDESKRFNVYCNMTAGGWTVIMRRFSKGDSINFKVPLANYKSGFGDLNRSHFLGLDHISLLTNIKDRDLMLIADKHSYRLRNFKVLDSYHHYKLVVHEEIDQIPDGCSFLRLNNTMFSAIDVDFDLAKNGNCSEGWNSGWWFTDCLDQSVCMTGLVMHSTKGLTKLSHGVMLIK